MAFDIGSPVSPPAVNPINFDLNKILGIFGPGQTGGPNSQSVVSYPFKNPRLVQTPIGGNWNGNFFYYFSILNANAQGDVTQGQPPNANILGKIGLNKNTFNFQIAPASISISNRFAVNLTATNGGVLEEHNSLVFRDITISGTTGLLPEKLNRNKSPSKATAVAQSLFPAATTAVTQLFNSVNKVGQAITGGKDGDVSSVQIDQTKTGYYQFWEMNNFLLAYANAKKSLTPQDAQPLRLIFGSGKDGIGYVVTPVSFDLRRDISNPLLYRYHIVLKAWDLITAASVVNAPPADIPSPAAQGIVAAVSSVLTQARNTINSAANVIKSVYSDFESVLNIGNQALLIVNDTANIASDILTFKTAFTSSANALNLAQTSFNNQNQMLSAINDPTERTNQPVATQQQISSLTKSQNPSGKTISTLQSAGLNASGPVSKITPGGEDKVDSEKHNVTPQAQTLIAKALNTSTFLSTPINVLDVPPQVQASIDNFRTSSQNLTVSSIQTLCNNYQAMSNNYSTSIGAMDATYAATYGVANPAVSNRVPTPNDIINLAAIQDSRSQFLSLLATGQFFSVRDADPFLSANDNLQSTDQLQTPVSMFPVPFPRGSTIAELAQRYLGDASRAREIEVLNNLRAPYIDETGFTVPMIGATGRTFVVQSIVDLSIGQQITIQGSGVLSTQRHILNITNLQNGEFQITVDGLPNLSTYTPSTNPFLQAFLPGTIGPGQFILIPSENVPDQFAAIRPTPLFNSLQFAQQVFKVDLALNTVSGKDIAVSSSGDAQLSYGYTNAIQALRLAVEVEQGELEHHTTYGLPIKVGQRNSDLSLDQAQSLLTATILNDPRFVEADIAININGSSVNVSIDARGAQGTGQIPVTFEVGTS